MSPIAYPPIRERFRSRGLAAAALAAALAACGPSTPPAAPPASPAPLDSPPPSAAAPAAASPGLSFDAADPASDCFSGFREPTDCAGLDLRGIRVGLADVAPALAGDAALQGRVVFAVTFETDLSQAEAFGLCLYLDLDQDSSTGLGMTDMPGLDRLICATLPAGDAWTQHVVLGGYEAEIVRDPARLTARVAGDLAILAVDPSLLADGPGAAPDGFGLYVASARSITQLDCINGVLPLHVPLLLGVPDEVIAQALGG